MPGISVIVPVYQAEKFLAQCVESVTRQTFADWELLLIDDGCTDASPALCDRFAEADGRIRAFHQPGNRGVSEARNLGLDKAGGECIAFLDADDQLEPQTLEELWNLRAQSGADTAGCAHWNVSDAGASPEQLLPAQVPPEQPPPLSPPSAPLRRGKTQPGCPPGQSCPPPGCRTPRAIGCPSRGRTAVLFDCFPVYLS